MDYVFKTKYCELHVTTDWQNFKEDSYAYITFKENTQRELFFGLCYIDKIYEEIIEISMNAHCEDVINLVLEKQKDLQLLPHIISGIQKLEEEFDKLVKE